MKTIIINRMYAGSYIDNKMGGEIINLLHDDNDNNYIFVNPYGYIDKKYNDTVEAVVLTRLLKAGCFEVLGIAKIGKNGQIVKPKGYLQAEKFASSIKQLKEYIKNNTIKYAGVNIQDIHGGDFLGADITFKSDKLLLPKQQLFITDEANKDYVPMENIAYNLSDKRFPKQSLISYITDEDNPVAFKTLQDIIANDELWEKNRINKVAENKIIDKHYNYLNIIRKEDDELVYSNLFYYFFAKYPDLFVKFADKVLGINMSNNITIAREKANIDLWISDEKNIVVIENKIKSGINGISVRHDFSEDGLVQSQLNKYFQYTEENKGDAMTHYFIFLPDYNKVDISIYSGSNHYKKIKYSAIYKFFEKQQIDDKYYNEFVNALYKHTKDRETDYYEDMAYRFLQKIGRIKSHGKI